MIRIFSPKIGDITKIFGKKNIYIYVSDSVIREIKLIVNMNDIYEVILY
jgi:hypothetical protein